MDGRCATVYALWDSQDLIGQWPSLPVVCAAAQVIRHQWGGIEEVSLTALQRGNEVLIASGDDLARLLDAMDEFRAPNSVVTDNRLVGAST